MQYVYMHLVMCMCVSESASNILKGRIDKRTERFDEIFVCFCMYVSVVM